MSHGQAQGSPVVVKVNEVDMQGNNKAVIKFDVFYHKEYIAAAGSIPPLASLLCSKSLPSSHDKQIRSSSCSESSLPAKRAKAAEPPALTGDNGGSVGDGFKTSLSDINNAKLLLEHELALFTAIEELLQANKANESATSTKKSSSSSSSSSMIQPLSARFSPTKKSDKDVRFMEFEDLVRRRFPDYRLQYSYEEKKEFLGQCKIELLSKLSFNEGSEDTHVLTSSSVKSTLKSCNLKLSQHQLNNVSKMVSLESSCDGCGSLTHALYGVVPPPSSHTTSALYYSPYFNHLSDVQPCLPRGGFLASTSGDTLTLSFKS
jgi:hypothetical protein